MLIDYQFYDTLEFDYDKYIVKIKNENDSVTIVRPIGSDSSESHGELYDLLWSPDSGRRFPDMLGRYKYINIHCEQVNDNQTVFVDHDDVLHSNKMVDSILIEPNNGEFFGIRNKYDNERKIYFKLTTPITKKNKKK